MTECSYLNARYYYATLFVIKPNLSRFLREQLLLCNLEVVGLILTSSCHTLVLPDKPLMSKVCWSVYLAGESDCTVKVLVWWPWSSNHIKRSAEVPGENPGRSCVTVSSTVHKQLEIRHESEDRSGKQIRQQQAGLEVGREKRSGSGHQNSEMLE